MSRKTAIVVLASITLAIVLGVLISNIPYTYIDPDSMPGCVAQYTAPDGSGQSEKLYLSGYRWKVEEPSTGEKVWDTAGPDNFFSREYGINEILPGDLDINMELVWTDPPDTIIIKRWPLSQWTPGDFDAIHTEGLEVARAWETHWKKTDIGFYVERGSLYGVWVHYGDAWVEYSFIVPAEDPTAYDYLGYFSGFDNPKAEEFTLDPIEWIDMSNTRRIDELNLNIDDDFPSGFYIYNPTKEAMPMRLTDQTKYAIIDPETGNTSKMVERGEFLNHLNQLPDFGETTPFWISETDGDVEFIKEQYVP